jgi:F subunit of K+-transporting ATPase (Potass_KdpF)
LHFIFRGLPEVIAMLEIIVGLIGVALIIYLLVTVIRPELF